MKLFLFKINKNITWQRCLRLHLTSEWEWYTCVISKNYVPAISRWCQGWHWAQHQWGSRPAGHSQECCGVSSDCPVGSEHSFLISFPLRNDDSTCSDMESLSSTRAPAPGCPGDAAVTGQGQPLLPAASPCLLLLGSSPWEDFMTLNI